MSDAPLLRALVPMAEVANVTRSIAFYEQMGFKVTGSFTPEGESEPTWAWLSNEAAQLMVTRYGVDATAPAPRRTTLFYIYCDDVQAARKALVERGVEAGILVTRFYAPKGEFEVVDPDGYKILVTHA